MTARSFLTIAVVAAAMGAAVGMSVMRLSDAGERLSRAHASHAALVADADVIAALRVRRQSAANAEQPPQDVVARVNRVLTSAGLPTRSATSITPQGSAPVRLDGAGATPYRRQTIQLELVALTPAEIGQFLCRWRRTEPLWSVERIELTHARSADGNSFDARFLLAALHVGGPDSP